MAEPSKPERVGFTLLELLVVICIISILLGLTLAGVQYARAAAAKAQCNDRLRQLGLALHNYHSQHGIFPPGVRRPPDPYPFMSWHTRILPFLDQSALWD